jgi:hypothetical protein
MKQIKGRNYRKVERGKLTERNDRRKRKKRKG